MKHPTCPHCGSRKTIRYGFPRWRCKRCKKTFRRRREDTRDRNAIDSYVKDRSTYRRLAERWGVSPSAAHARVQRALARRRTLLERTGEGLDGCDGVSVLDGKHVRVNGVSYTIFVIWDRGLGLPIHFLLKEGGERELWYWKLLLELKCIGYEPKAFVSDGLPTLKEFLHEQYPDLPHQRCTVHVFLKARSLVVRGRRTTPRAGLFVELLRDVLWSGSEAIAKRKVARIRTVGGLTEHELAALSYVEGAIPECFVATDAKWKNLSIPRSSNAIENVIGQVEARLKTRRGTKSEESLNLLVNELLLQVKKQCIK